MKKIGNRTSKANRKTSVKTTGWRTTDDYEIELRRERVKNEPMRVTASTPARTPYKDYAVSRLDDEHPTEYRVELRSLTERINTCNCPDFRKNFLGTCKHVEKVLAQIPTRGKGPSPYIEIYMNRSPWQPVVRIPENHIATKFIRRYLTANGFLKTDAADTLQVLQRDLDKAPEEIRAGIRISAEVREYVRREIERKMSARWRENYAQQFRESHGAAPFLRHALYDYQIEGMLHLAFNGRALLADEMGLGKTVQAVAASALLKECFETKRVLVVTPASLKSEWEEQIRKFTSLPVEIVFGARKHRLDLYRRSKAFFLLVNYEQVMIDYEDLNRDFQPDLIILDEAQRIKNWKTKTADRLKRLRSRFAFVLTGTPLENKIDELYSLVEFVDPSLFGSLFRFNRRFYDLNDDGKVVGMKNLRELHELVEPVMLRRRKDEISEQLPERVDNNYFVTMTKEQKAHYADHEQIVSRLANAAQRRPLTPEEMDRMQQALSCMRMVCDSVYILDQKVKDAPKLDELLHVLDDLWEDNPDRKVIVFSEWVRMLELLEARLAERQIKYALHTGAVNQIKRREEINRFKNDADCRLFLSSDSGSVGLNLQVASVVVNLDLPWNPAKLEQRIARAWRKHQKNTVNVINLIAENTLEHRMLATLDFKKGLADAVLDARGDFATFEQADARSAFMTRLNTILAVTPESVTAPEEAPSEPPAVPPAEQLKQELALDPAGINLCHAVYDRVGGKLKSVFAVGSAKAAEQLKKQVAKTHGELPGEGNIAVISPENYALLQQLAQMGVITINRDHLTKVFEAETVVPKPPSLQERRLALSRPALDQAGRQLKMASVLHAGGFAAEAAAPARQAIHAAAIAVYFHSVAIPPEKAPAQLNGEMIKIIGESGNLDRQQLLLLQLCQPGMLDFGEIKLEDASGFVAAATELVNQQAMTPMEHGLK